LLRSQRTRPESWQPSTIFRRKTSDDPQAAVQYSDEDFEALIHSIQHCDSEDQDQELPFVESIAVSIHVSGGQVVQGAPLGILHIKHKEQHLKWLIL